MGTLKRDPGIDAALSRIAARRAARKETDDGVKRYTVSELKEMAEVLGIRQKNDPAATTVTAPTLQGPFPGNTDQLGIFSSYEVRPERFSALTRPRTLAKLLNLNKSVFHEETLEIMTGVTASSGTNATGFCGNPPTVGQGKVCKQNYAWGRYYVKTNLDAIPEIGTLRSRAEVPGKVLNAGPAASPLVPDVMYKLADTRSQLQYELFMIGVSLERSMEKVLVTGDTSLASANTNHGWISEFAGLDGQVKTGYADVTGLVCPAADSAIVAFNAAVTSVIGGGDGRNIVQAGTDLYWALNDRATEMGMGGVEFSWIMRKEAFRSIAEVWACNYATYRCQAGTAGQPFVENVEGTNRLRLEMMSGQYLLVDGVPVPVTFSEGIPQQSQGGSQFKSDVYLAPISWNGIPLLRLEYFPMDNQYATEFADFQGESIAVINNGMYIVGNRNTGLCKEYHFGAKFRMILETPFLAGRIDDVAYTFRAPIRNADPGDTFFYADGGATYR